MVEDKFIFKEHKTKYNILTCVCNSQDLNQVQECEKMDESIHTESFECQDCGRIIHITYYIGEEDENNQN